MHDSRTPLEFFEDRYVVPKAGRTLIVGSRIYSGKEDRRKRYPDVLGIDMLEGEGVDRVIDLELPLPADLGRFHHVECMSVLEHSRRPWLLAANLERLLRKGGTIYLTVPFVWRVHSYPNDYWRFTKEGVRSIFPGINWIRLMYAHEDLKHNDFVPQVDKAAGGHPYLARTEVAAFGMRPA